MNMTADNPVLTSPRGGGQGNDQPTRVRAFKAVHLPMLPSAHTLAAQKSLASVGGGRSLKKRTQATYESDKSTLKLVKIERPPFVSHQTSPMRRINENSVQTLRFDPSSAALLSTAMGKSASKAQTSLSSLPFPAFKQCKAAHGARGYADELFEMRLKQPEIKQYRRNMIDPQKFTFQRRQMLAPR